MIQDALNWLIQQVENFGYLGIFVMMLLESTFFPFPSEVAMIPAGYLAHQERMSLPLAILAGLAGSLAGALINYYLARKIGIPFLRRYGKFFFFDERKLERCNQIFRRHGEITTFVCRLIPLVRQYISLPAGIARMDLTRFTFYTGLGAGIWVAVLAIFGYWVGNRLESVEGNPTWENYKSLWDQHEQTILLYCGGGLALLVVFYVIWQKKRRRRLLPPEPPAVETPPGSPES